MRIKKWIDIQREIEVDVCREDIYDMLVDAPAGASQDEILQAINRFAGFLRAVPLEILTDKQKSIISGFLREQAERFNETHS